VSDSTLTIDGKNVPGERSFGVINPATGQVFAEAPDATRAQLDRAMDAASRALPGWQADLERRRKALRDGAAAIRARAKEIAPLLTREQGKPLARANEELAGTAAWFDYSAGLEIPLEVVQDDADTRIEVRRRPLGVVAAITAWNYPLMLASWKIAPALLAGNTVVLKPSPFTPLSTLALGDALREVLPPGVLNVVSGGDELGAWMTSHPIPRKISFTGSVATGKRVAAAAAPDLKRVTLELGGNDPAIVLEDVDPKAVADRLFWGAFANTGQICTAIKRVFVPEKLYRPLVAELALRAKSVKMGDGFDPEVQLGPLNNRMQFERVCELVEDARQHGASFAAGGKPRAGGGYFFEPTIVTDVKEGTRIVDEEQFGPALPVLPYRDVEEAIARANATHYGLGGSVWSTDVSRATELAGRLESGNAWVNQHPVALPYTPFGGSKWSGIGVENGPWGLLGFTEIQTLIVKKR